jgi:hypothetical protein
MRWYVPAASDFGVSRKRRKMSDEVHRSWALVSAAIKERIIIPNSLDSARSVLLRELRLHFGQARCPD